MVVSWLFFSSKWKFNTKESSTYSRLEFLDKNIFKPYVGFSFFFVSPSLPISNNFVFLKLHRRTAIMGRIVEREPNRYAKDTPYQSTKFNIQIQAVFKKSQDSAATTVRKTVPLIISAKDLECRCPRLKANRWVFHSNFHRYYTTLPTHTRTQQTTRLLDISSNWNYLLPSYWTFPVRNAVMCGCSISSSICCFV